ncbi:MAG: hypothetical protein ACOC2W_02460 [bacterium]
MDNRSLEKSTLLTNKYRGKVVYHIEVCDEYAKIVFTDNTSIKVILKHERSFFSDAVNLKVEALL